MPTTTPDLVLTEQQKAFFTTFGYLALPGLLKDRIGAVTDAFEEVFKKHGGGHDGKPHDGKNRSCIVPFPDKHAVLAGLLDDPRIHGLATSLLGDDFNYMASDGNYYSGDTNWHSDGWHVNPIHIKIAFYLDPLTRDTGCIRVIPGSHIVGDTFAETVNKNVGWNGVKVGVEPRDVPCVALETVPGDIVVFSHNTKHAAFGGGGWRRMFTINLCQRYPKGRENELQDYMRGWSRFWMERGYEPLMIDTASPQRMRHLEQVLANDGHLAGLTREAKEKMAEPARG
ncbi:MAG: phytanoyl-CoA dioxygenase family protein [Planctomycetota bacterium]|nr:phytanoyl-CoA dioxygenase family protein [Planctomycetota bacterium]